MKYKYRTIIYQEPLLGSIFLAGAKVDPERLTDFLNRNAAQGWRVRTMEREIRRALLFFQREAFLIILEQEVANGE